MISSLALTIPSSGRALEARPHTLSPQWAHGRTASEASVRKWTKGVLPGRRCVASIGVTDRARASRYVPNSIEGVVDVDAEEPLDTLSREGPRAGQGALHDLDHALRRCHG